MKIGELADRTGSSPRSLRHYESTGLIRSVRQLNGYRDFDTDQVERVLVIRDLLAAGLNLDAIASIAPCYEGDGIPRRCTAATARVRAELARLDRRVEELATARRRLQALAAPR